MTSQAPRIQGLDAVILITPNFAAQCRFYAEVLGLEVVSQWDDGAFFRAGEQIIGIFAQGHHAEGDKRLDGADHGLSHLEFRVAQADFERFREHLTAAGHHAYRDNFQDADGNLFHFNLTEEEFQSRTPG